MQEFLLIVGERLEQDQLYQYQQRSQSYFDLFDIKLTAKLHVQKNCALIEFTKDTDTLEVYEDKNTGDFVACLGSWFFREETNDTDTNQRRLLHQLIHNTNHSLQSIEGAYNFIFYNAHQQCVRIVTDRIGLCPSYLRKMGARDFISSNCLLLASLHAFELDQVGLQEFLLANKFFGTTTLFKGIQKIEPASILEYTPSGSKISSYWSLHCDGRRSELSTREKVEEFSGALRSVMRRLGEKFNSLFIDLTAGWDSRTVIVAMPDMLPHFSAVTSGATEEDEDVRIAKQIAECLRVPHYFNPSFSASTQFSGDSYAEYLRQAVYLTDGAMSAPLYVNTLVTKLRNISYGADLTLNGSGGELYRAYWWEPAHIYNSNVRCRQVALPGLTSYYDKRELARRVMHQQSDLSIFHPDFDTAIYKHLIEIFEKTNAPYMPLSNIDQIANIYIVHRMGNWLAGYSKATSRLLPCLSPVLMSKPLEIAAQLRMKEKIFCRFLRQFHQAASPKVARIETGYGYSTEPFALKNVERFLPAVQKTIAGLSTKISARLGMRTASAALPQLQKNARTAFEVLELEPGSMRLSGIFDQARLIAFLQSARESTFPYRDLYHNVYTVEAILRLLT